MELLYIMQYFPVHIWQCYDGQGHINKGAESDSNQPQPPNNCEEVDFDLQIKISGR